MCGERDQPAVNNRGSRLVVDDEFSIIEMPNSEFAANIGNFSPVRGLYVSALQN
jgi:hypothetical protein